MSPPGPALTSSTIYVPSKPALRVLRQLALAGSTLGAIGSVCGLAVLSYDLNRRVKFAEQLVENKRQIQAVPGYDGGRDGAGSMLMKQMVEAAESGDFNGVDNLRARGIGITSSSSGRDSGSAWRTRKSKSTARGEQRRSMHTAVATSEPTQGPNDHDHLNSPQNNPHARPVHWPADPKGFRPSMPREDRLISASEVIHDRAGQPVGSIRKLSSRKQDLKDSTFKAQRPTRSKSSRPIENRLIKANQRKPQLRVRGALGPDTGKGLLPYALRTRPRIGLTLQDRQKWLRQASQGDVARITEKFLRAVGDWNTLKQLSPEEAELAIELFYLNLDAGDISKAKGLYSLLSAMKATTQAVWELTIIAHAKSKHWELASQTYLEYAKRYQLSDSLTEPLLRALLNTGRLEMARNLLLRQIDLDSECALSSIFLLYIWKKTRTLAAVKENFAQLLAVNRRESNKVTIKLVNPMIKALVESRNIEEAKALLQEMQETYGVQPSVRTHGFFIYQQALELKWADVEEGLSDLTVAGSTRAEPRDFTHLFSRIFLEFYATHGAPDIHAFVMNGIIEYKLRIDQVLFDSIIEAYVQRHGTSEMLSEFLDECARRRFRVSFDRVGLMSKLSRRDDLVSSPRQSLGVWHMIRKTQSRAGPVIARRETTEGVEDARFGPGEWREDVRSWISRGMKMRNPVNLNQFISLRQQMLTALREGKLEKTRVLFEAGIRAGSPIRQIHFEIALVASTIQEGLSSTTRALLTHAFEHNAHESIIPLYLQRLQKLDPADPFAAVSLSIRHFYTLMSENNLNPTHSLLRKTVTCYLHQNMTFEARNLMYVVSRTYWQRSILPFTIADWTLYLDALIRKESINLKHVIWVAHQVQRRELRLLKEYPSQAESPRPKTIFIDQTYTNKLSQAYYRIVRQGKCENVVIDPALQDVLAQNLQFAEMRVRGWSESESDVYFEQVSLETPNWNDIQAVFEIAKRAKGRNENSREEDSGM